MTEIHLFPGQGSHQVGMGRDLFATYPYLARQAEAVLGYSVEELCLNGPAERLAETRYTQPALYVVDALSHVHRVRESGVVPDVVAGHSLGEYAALFAAGAFDFVTGLEIVERRAELMARQGAPDAAGDGAGDGAPGGMAAVLGLTEDEVRAGLERNGAEATDLANLNAPRQIVISGPREELTRLGPLLERDGARRVVLLNVSGAFHSRHMAGAAEEFAAFLAGFRLSEPKIPVISNVTARPHEPDRLAELLAAQLTRPVRWSQTLDYLLSLPDPQLHEVGPGKILTGLVAQVPRPDHSQAGQPSQPSEPAEMTV